MSQWFLRIRLSATASPAPTWVIHPFVWHASRIVSPLLLASQRLRGVKDATVSARLSHEVVYLESNFLKPPAISETGAAPFVCPTVKAPRVPSWAGFCLYLRLISEHSLWDSNPPLHPFAVATSPLIHQNFCIIIVSAKTLLTQSNIVPPIFADISLKYKGVSHLGTKPSPELGHPPVCAVRMPYRITAIMAFGIVQVSLQCGSLFAPTMMLPMIAVGFSATHKRLVLRNSPARGP